MKVYFATSLSESVQMRMGCRLCWVTIDLLRLLSRFGGVPPQVEGRAPTGAAAIDSARQNLASTFVNAFVNAGFGQDKLVSASTVKHPPEVPCPLRSFLFPVPATCSGDGGLRGDDKRWRIDALDLQESRAW